MALAVTVNKPDSAFCCSEGYPAGYSLPLFFIDKSITKRDLEQSRGNRRNSSLVLKSQKQKKKTYLGGIVSAKPHAKPWLWELDYGSAQM